MTIQSINPATEETLARFDEFSAEQVEACLARAHAASRAGARITFAERASPMRKVAAYLRAHASNVPPCALAIEQCFREGGFEHGVFQNLLVAGAGVEPVISDRRVQAVSLTGSTATGARIASVAGGALKKCVLELGGSDP